jgi:hypothetical protein
MSPTEQAEKPDGTPSAPELPFVITVRDRRSMDRDISKAEAAVRERATREKRGILVTRHDIHHFSITVSDDVPVGLTREQQIWSGTRGYNTVA